jgi:hypothetical protein
MYGTGILSPLRTSHILLYIAQPRAGWEPDTNNPFLPNTPRSPADSREPQVEMRDVALAPPEEKTREDTSSGGSQLLRSYKKAQAAGRQKVHLPKTNDWQMGKPETSLGPEETRQGSAAIFKESNSIGVSGGHFSAAARDVHLHYYHPGDSSMIGDVRTIAIGLVLGSVAIIFVLMKQGSSMLPPYNKLSECIPL